jgi:hypothetical protein
VAYWDIWRLVFLETILPWQTTNNPRNADTGRSFGRAGGSDGVRSLREER